MTLQIYYNVGTISSNNNAFDKIVNLVKPLCPSALWLSYSMYGYKVCGTMTA